MKIPKILTVKKGNNLISNILHSNIQAHVYHLQTKSYAKHKALEGFYTEIVDLFDSLVETYQGKYGIITNYNNITFSSETEVSYFNQLRVIVESNRYTEFSTKDTHLQNIIDEITALIDSTLYKLNNLS